MQTGQPIRCVPGGGHPPTCDSVRLRGPSWSAGELCTLFTLAGLLSVILTWPLILAPGTALPRYLPLTDHDIYSNMWSIWWAKTAFLENLPSLFFTDKLFHPAGTPLSMTSLSPLNALLLWPLANGYDSVRGVILAYNVYILTSFALAFVATYFLVREVTLSRSGAVIGAFVFAASPYRFDHLRHIDLLSTHWTPLFFLAFWKTLDGPRRSWPLWTALLGIAGALIIGTCLTYASTTPVFAAIFLIGWGFFRHPSPIKVIGRLLPGALISLFLSLPAWLPLVNHARNIQFESPLLEEVVAFSFSLEHFFSRPLHPYLGLAALVLALLGWRDRLVPARNAWALMAGCGFLLALGPYLKIGTHSTGMPLPYLAMFKYGFVFGQSRFTERFLVYWFLGIAVLAGAGTQRLVSRFKSRGRRIRWVTILVLVIGLDALNSPLTTYVPTIPEPYTVIRELDRTIPVFEEPHNYLANRIWMFNQIRHEHPIMQGHLARRSLESYRWEETNTALDIPRIILNIHHDMDGHPPHSSCLDTLRRRYDWSLLAKDQGMESYLLVLKGEAGS